MLALSSNLSFTFVSPFPAVCMCVIINLALPVARVCISVSISVYLSHYSGIGGQLARRIKCLNSVPGGKDQTTVWGERGEGWGTHSMKPHEQHPHQSDHIIVPIVY